MFGLRLVANVASQVWHHSATVGCCDVKSTPWSISAWSFLSFSRASRCELARRLRRLPFSSETSANQTPESCGYSYTVPSPLARPLVRCAMSAPVSFLPVSKIGQGDPAQAAAPNRAELAPRDQPPDRALIVTEQRRGLADRHLERLVPNRSDRPLMCVVHPCLLECPLVRKGLTPLPQRAGPMRGAIRPAPRAGEPLR